MAETRPWLFAVIPELSTETQLYTARRNNAAAPGEFRFTIADLLAFLRDQGVVVAPLVEAIAVSGSEEITVPAGSLLQHVVATGADGPVLVGTTEDGNEIIDSAISGSAMSENIGWFFEAETTIWVTGTCTVRFYFR